MAAIRRLIETMDFKFAEEDDPNIEEKPFLATLHTIGRALKTTSPTFENLSSLDSVIAFINWIKSEGIDQLPEYREILEKPPMD